MRSFRRDRWGVSALRRSLAALALVATSAPLAAQTPQVYYACYVPLTGTVYRIMTPDTKPACSSTSHVQFSWTDGLGALRPGAAAVGDLAGTFPNPSVVALRGLGLSATAPTSGQVLTYNGSVWAPAMPVTGVTAHGLLTGLLNDDHPQYLLTDGTRNSPNGFVVAGATGTGSIPATGAGTRLMWYPGKAAFRAGSIQSSQWDDASIGTNSVAMGRDVMASNYYATALGISTVASGIGSTALGGYTQATGDYSLAAIQGAHADGSHSVAIGNNTHATGSYAIALGANSYASGNFSMALGQAASTASHSGSFVYADNSNTQWTWATADNQFTVRAAGGVRLRTASDQSTGCDLPAGSGSWSCTSSRLAKTDFSDLAGEDVLARIARLPIQSWRYRSDPVRARHVGPTAQDFRAAFGLGDDDRAISLVDADGVSLLAAQALERRTRALERENAELKARLERLEAALRTLAAQR